MALNRRDEADLPTVVDQLAHRLEQAQTPSDLSAVLVLADAIAERARLMKRSAKANGLVSAARDAYAAQVRAVFARVEVVRRAAALLPGPGQPSKEISADQRIRADDFGIGHDTAARWKAWGDALATVEMADVQAKWDTVIEAEPGEWVEPTLKAIIGEGRATTSRTLGDVGVLDGEYRCIVIDPPWPIAKIERDERPRQAAHLDYPTMTVDEIQALPIPELAADGCHVYLWVTHRFLPAGLELLEAWGARYECQLTWRKNVGMTPFSWMYDTEHVLFARIGSLALEQQGLRLSFDAKAVGHSVKPDVFYERVAAASPEPRLEMFARRQRDGFDGWGDEA